MSTLADTQLDNQPAVTSPGRLRLAPYHRHPGALDGAWWPRSRDLDQELRALMDTWEVRLGPLTRALVNPRHWPEISPKTYLNGKVLKVSSFVEQDANKLILFSRTTNQRWDLLVVPPETERAEAIRMMAAASETGNVSTASELVAGAGIDAPEPDDRSAEKSWTTRKREAVWEWEGGGEAGAESTGSGRPADR